MGNEKDLVRKKEENNPKEKEIMVDSVLVQSGTMSSG